MTPPSKRFWIGAAVVALAIPALAQERPTSILPPGFGDPTPPPPPAASRPPAPARPSAPRAATPGVQHALQAPAQPAAPASPDPLAPASAAPPVDPGAGPPAANEGQVSESDSLDNSDLAAADIPEPVEIPDSQRRDPDHVGRLDPAAIGLGSDPWGSASGAFLERAMRRTNGALPSRWLHIALRNALLAKAETPFGPSGADWVAERSWLLLRMGEADAARMIVAGVDVADFTPKLAQIAVQSALATADPAAMCPVRQQLGTLEKRVSALVDAICASLSGNPETAAADIDDARRRDRMRGIDVSLADKLVGAGAESARAVTLEWDPVDSLTAWRFGLASASGIAIPARLLDASSAPVRAWAARAPMIGVSDRLASARIATGLGVFSGQALVDLYAAQYDRTDPDDLTKSDAWQLRVAFLGRDRATRLDAMRKLWGKGDNSLDHEAARAMLAVAASQVAPDAALADDAPDLIASMLAGGMDEAAARWVPVVEQMADAQKDKCWAMLVLAAPTARGLDVSYDRIDKFIGRDASSGHRRGALLVAGLTGIGRIDGQTAGRLSGRYGFGLDRRNEWTNLIDGAAERKQGGTATVLAGLAFNAAQWNGIPALFLFHSVAALADTGQDFNARMIAAEALSRS